MCAVNVFIIYNKVIILYCNKLETSTILCRCKNQ